MNKRSPKESKISKIGLLFKLEGGMMFLPPFETRALIGYEEEKTLKDEQPLILGTSHF